MSWVRCRCHDLKFQVVFLKNLSLSGNHLRLLYLVEQNRREISSVPGSPFNKKQLTSAGNQYLNQGAQEEFNQPSWFHFMISQNRALKVTSVALGLLPGSAFCDFQITIHQRHFLCCVAVSTTEKALLLAQKCRTLKDRHIHIEDGEYTTRSFLQCCSLVDCIALAKAYSLLHIVNTHALNMTAKLGHREAKPSSFVLVKSTVEFSSLYFPVALAQLICMPSH